MSDEQQQCRECFEVCYPRLDALEAERDRIKIQDAVHHAQLEEARAEIDRLKAELSLWEGAHGLDRERNLWKSKAEKLADVLKHCVRVKCEPWPCKAVQEAIAEFEK